MMRRLILALCLLPLPLHADPPGLSPLPDLGPPLTAAEFDAYATGKTLTFALDGIIWGSEQYLAGRRVLWAFTGQQCEHGQWYEDQGAICFVYEARPEPSCWFFFQGPFGLVASVSSGDGQLSKVDQTAKPMTCPGPQVGT